MRPVIEAKDLGIEFYRSRRRKMSLREIVFKGNQVFEFPIGRHAVFGRLSQCNGYPD